MSTHELREALESHATFEDTAALVRLGDVKRRVRVVRRRRRAAIAGAAAAVVLAGSGVAVLLPGHGSADRQFAGMTAPATMTSLGYTYTFDKLVVGDTKASFSDDIEGPFLVTWADAGDGVLTVLNPDDDSSTLTSRGDFHDFVAVGGNEERSVKLDGQGEVALAVYRLSGYAPGNGLKDGGEQMTFRDDIGSARAITSAWGKDGDTDLKVTFTYPGRTLVQRDFCSAPKGYDLHVDIAGPGSVGQCQDSFYFDGPGNSVSWSSGLERPDGTEIQPGDRVTAHLWISRHNQDEPVAARIPGLRLGIGLYEETPPVAKLEGFNMTEYREEAGHLFRFVEVVKGDGPARTWKVSRTVGDKPLVFVLVGGESGGVTQVLIDGVPGTHYSAGTGAFATTAGPLGPGKHAVELRSHRAGRFGAAIYEQVD